MAMPNEWRAVLSSNSSWVKHKKKEFEMPQLDNKVVQADKQDLLESIQIKRVPGKTYVIAIVHSKQSKDNRSNEVSCRKGIAFGGYCYDASRDTYRISCVEAVELGPVMAAYTASYPNVGNWQAHLPLPKKVLERHFSGKQKEIVEKLCDHYDQEKFTIDFVQMRDCNG